MMTKAIVRCGLLAAALLGVAGDGYAQHADAATMLQFQRAADSYAFAHRQDERRHVSAPPLSEGQFFTPIVADAFRLRIRRVARECSTPEQGEGGVVVPAVNGSASGAAELPACVVAALPHLPSELEYRSAGVALLLIDANRGVVVDILHAAFP